MKPSILLLSQLPPSSENTTGVVLNHFTHLLDADIDCIGIVNSNCNNIVPSKDFLGEYSKYYSPDLAVGKAGRLVRALAKKIGAGKIFDYLHFYLVAQKKIEKLGNIVISIIKKKTYDKIWILLETPQVILIANKMITEMTLPIYVMIFDEPEWYIDVNIKNGAIRKKTLEAYRNTIQLSSGCAAASRPMAQKIIKEYGVSCITAIKPVVFFGTIKRLASISEVVIGFAGQLYAKDAWDELITMLSTHDWQLAGIPVSIRYWGRRFTMDTLNEVKIDYRGWISEDALGKELEKCTFLYCPYPFDAKLDYVCRYSFPSKLPGYLASGVPTIFHGPEYSSPFELGRDALILEPNLGCSGLFDILNKILGDADTYSRISASAIKCARDLFSVEIAKENINTFFQVKPNE